MRHFKIIRGFNKHQRTTKHVSYFAHRGRLLFYRKKKQLVWITLYINKKYIINLNENVITICCLKGPLVLRYALVMWTLHFSHFFRFPFGLDRICSRAKVRNLVFIIFSLLVGIDCVTDNLKATFSWMKKHALLFSNLVPRMLKIGL